MNSSAQTAPSLVIERTFPTDAATLYRAWTDPLVMAKWFFVEPEGHAIVENDLRVGGGYKLEMVFPNDVRHAMHGEYEALETDRRVVFTWNSHVATGTRVTVELEPKGDMTLLRLTHEFIPDAALREQHGFGWGGCLDNLAKLGS